MKPTLQFRQSQHLALTPQLQQSIRLLQLSTIELNQEIERMLIENPILERVDEGTDTGSPRTLETQYEYSEPSGQSEHPEHPEQSAPSAQEPLGDSDSSGAPEQPYGGDDWGRENAGQGADDEDADRTFQAPDLPSLRDHLIAQLSLTQLCPRDRALVEILIDALDEDGYLAQPLEEILELLDPEDQVEKEDLAIALQHLQHLEPAGVGARSPGECLALQLRSMDNADGSKSLAIEIALNHLPLLASRDYARLKGATGAGEELLRAAHRLIRRLNPRPGSAFARLEARYVVPDVIVSKVRNVWRARLNTEAMPKLRVNRLYAEFAAAKREGPNNLSGQLQEARWLIKNIQQRFDTILRVSQAIVDRQRRFFEHGEVAMRPLVLREIADVLGLHESTISRVTTQKFMATPRGTLELKYFFGSHVATDTGGAASSTAIRALIKQLVAAENPDTPLSDSRLSQILAEQGIVVARRTIAKYRDALQIFPVNQRKRL